MVITITPEDLVWNQDALDRTHILLKIKSMFQITHFAYIHYKTLKKIIS